MAIPVIPFIVGCQRSGTSLLTVLLDRHSRLAMLPETHLLTTLTMDRPGWPLAPTHEHLLLGAWHRAWYRLRDLQFEPASVLQRLRRHPCTPEGLMLALLELWADREGKPYAGEKTPQHIEVVDRIVERIPGSKVTVIVRDGRAVVQSRRRGRDPDGPVDELVDHWVACAQLADRWLTEFPERVRVVRFEELSANPEQILASLLEWYGLSFEPAQLTPGPSPTFRRWEGHYKQDAEGPIDQSRGEAWRSAEEALSSEQLGRMVPWLARFGYPEPSRTATAPSSAGPREACPARTRRRLTPLFLIGAQRAGGASVAAWLASDPAVAFPHEKQPSALATLWPIDREGFLQHLAAKLEPEQSGVKVVGDFAPYYLLHPDLPRRARQIAPEARIIVMLRDPVARAFSHWFNEWRMGAEPLPFGEALAAETARLGDVELGLSRSPAAVSFAHVHYSYALRSGYAAQLARWYGHFPAEQILVVVFEELLADPAATWARLCDFLEMETAAAPELPHKQALKWPASREKLLRTPEAIRLRADLAPDTHELERLLGRSLPWPAAGAPVPA